MHARTARGARSARSSLTMLVAVATAILLAVPAWASSGVSISSFTNDPTTEFQPVKTVTEANTTVIIKTIEIDFGGGITVTHAGDSYAPQVGEKVGELKIRTRLREFFCINTTYTLPAYWDTVAVDAPSGTVAQLEIVTPTNTTLPAYIIEDNGDYSILADLGDPPDNPCSNVSAEITATTFSHSAGTSAVVARNAGAGSYTLTVIVTEHNSTTHQDTEPYTVTS